MEYRPLGNTGIRVSSLCFGTMSFGDAADEPTSRAMYAQCREAGVNTFDCANVYAGGRSEEILGRLVADERADVVLTTKVGFAMGDGPNDIGLSARHIGASVEASLRRLATDRVEVLFVHTVDPRTPVETTLRALDRLVQQGKVLSLGASNWAAWRIAHARGISARESLAPFDVIQPMYNLVKRQAEVEILPMCRALGLGVISYSPLGGGLLTGKYARSERPDAGRLVDNRMYAARYGDAAYYDVAESFRTLAGDVGVPPATLAVAWVARHPGVTAPLIGARNLKQLKESLAATRVSLSDELYQQISNLSPAPPPATDRTEERRGVQYKGSEEKYK